MKITDKIYHILLSERKPIVFVAAKQRYYCMGCGHPMSEAENEILRRQEAKANRPRKKGGKNSASSAGALSTMTQQERLLIHGINALTIAINKLESTIAQETTISDSSGKNKQRMSRVATEQELKDSASSAGAKAL